MWFYTVNIVIVALAIALELHPNKYLGNLLLLGKLWVTFISLCALIMALILAAKIRTKANTNFALNLTTPKTSWRKVLGWVYRTLAVASVPTFFVLGQWWLAIGVASIVVEVVAMKKAAREYMSMVTINPQTKAVVIDVVPE